MSRQVGTATLCIPAYSPDAEGNEIWVTAENAYNERVARVENQIIARLRDRLGTARNANEMFRVFSKFNALFVRPKVFTVSRLTWKSVC